MAHLRPLKITIPWRDQWFVEFSDEKNIKFAPSTHILSEKEYSKFLLFGDVRKQLEENKQKRRPGWKTDFEEIPESDMESFAIIRYCPIVVTVEHDDVYKASQIELLNPHSGLVRITWPLTRKSELDDEKETEDTQDEAQEEKLLPSGWISFSGKCSFTPELPQRDENCKENYGEY